MRSYIACIFLLLTITCQGQFNYKVGYDLSYVRATALDEIVDRFNIENDFLEDEMRYLRFISGLELGVRYTFGPLSTECSFSNISRSRSSLGIDPVSNSDFSKKLFYNMRKYSVGLQYQIQSFGIGASIGTRRIRVRTDVPGSEVRPTLVSEYNTFSRFNLIYQLGEGSYRIAMMPYIELGYGSVNIAPIEDNILSEPTNTGERSESFPVFGISFVFYNGPDRR